MTTLILKKCKTCGEEKPIIFFNKASKGKGIFQSNCKQCSSKIAIKWQKNNPEKHRNNQLSDSRKSSVYISNNYLSKVFYASTKRGLKLKDMPSNIIEVKRLQITLHRLIKEKSVQQSQSV